MRRFLLRVPFFRWCALQHLRQVRQKRTENAWAHTEPVLVALGNITISWAGISLILNRFIEVHHLEIGNIAKTGLPRNFTSKLDYIKKVERDPRWDPQKVAELREMRLQLAMLNEKRVQLTHGLLMRRGYGPAFNVHIAKEGADTLHRSDVPYSGQDVMDFSRELSEMGSKLSVFFMPIVAK